MSARRQGVTLFELLLALVLLLMATASLMQILGMRTQLERSVLREEMTLREANNLLEQLAGLSWEQLDAQQIAPFVQAANARLEEGVFEVEVTSTPEDDTARQIRVWLPSSTSSETGRVRCLTTWRYALVEVPAEEGTL